MWFLKIRSKSYYSLIVDLYDIIDKNKITIRIKQLIIDISEIKTWQPHIHANQPSTRVQWVTTNKSYIMGTEGKNKI